LVIERFVWFVLAGLVLAGRLPVSAHHSVLPFDGATPTAVTGTVTRALWRNPHTYIYMDVRGDQGVERWVIESEAVVVLERLGWTRDLISVGDTITMTGAQARDGRRLMRCAFVGLREGRRLPCFSNESIAGK